MVCFRQGKAFVRFAYLTCTSGVGRINLVKPAQLGQLVALLHLPFCILAVWNMVPEQLGEAVWMDRLGAVLVKPSSASRNCSAGGRIIDFVVCSADRLQHTANREAEVIGPWAPHCGLLGRQPEALRVTVLRKHSPS